ncbi:MAG: metallophosphoesterase family protein [Bacilli bacterium]|nr:metallophosphoesterase family protein [Bacilli bacterium]
MKVAVFSDIHGNYQALKAIIGDIKCKQVDQVIFLGDAVGLGPDHNECLELLNSMPNLTFLYGNHELYCTRGHEIDPYVASYEDRLVHHLWVNNTVDKKLFKKEMLYHSLELCGKRFSFSHYFLRDNDYPFYNLDIIEKNRYKDFVKNLNYDYIFIGHHHDGLVEEIKDKHLYCVGSSGCVPSNITYYYLINATDKISVEKVNVQYNREKLIGRINHVKYPGLDTIKEKFFNVK